MDRAGFSTHRGPTTGSRSHLAIVAVAAAAALALVAPRHANAASDPQAKTLLLQSAATFLPGDRIRVTSPEPAQVRLAGWYSGLESDSILRVRFARSEPPASVHLRQIGLLETRVGAKRHFQAGAIVGCLVGTLVGLAAAPAEDPVVPLYTDDRGRTFAIRMKGLRKTYVAICAASGFVLGGSVGYLIKTDRWGFVARFD